MHKQSVQMKFAGHSASTKQEPLFLSLSGAAGSSEKLLECQIPENMHLELICMGSKPIFLPLTGMNQQF